MRLWPIRRTRPSPPAPGEPRDAHAYRLLEEARLHCLRLRDSSSEATGDRFRIAYREIGMAGYLASACIPSHRRLEILGEARQGAARQAGHSGAQQGQGAPRALLALVEAAAATLQQALVAPGITDHLVAARDHVTQALLVLAPGGSDGAQAATRAIHG